jgi:hypothetical protein
LDQVRERIRVKHYSICTKTQYVHWIKNFILFHYKKYPKEMAAAKVKVFLTHLAADELVSVSTQNQAFIFPLIPAFSLWSRGNLRCCPCQ